jgi:hypothetical protein
VRQPTRGRTTWRSVGVHENENVVVNSRVGVVKMRVKEMRPICWVL